MLLTLQAEDAQLLHEVLSRCLTDLRGEVGGTHDYEYRQELHRREAMLRAILDQIAAQLSGSIVSNSPSLS